MTVRALVIGLVLWVGLLAAPSRAQSRVEALLAAMTLEEKVGQMFMSNLYGAALNAPGRALLETWKPGSAVLFATNIGDPASTTALINDWQAAVTEAGGLPMFISTDQEGGVIARLKDGFTTLPAMMLLTATGDVTLAQRTGQTLARELSAVGVNLNLAPVADLYTNLRNPVIGRRSFGSEPERTGQMLAALIRGMQGGGVLATAKHFPGHGDTDQDSHVSLPTVNYPREELERVELAPFRWTVAAGVEAVMVAHIWYPAYDPDGEIPASLSRNIVTGLLREELGFDGLIITDAIEMDAIDRVYSYPEASILSIDAGVDIVAFGASLSPQSQIAAMSGVVEAVRSGRLSEARIDESVRRILDAKLRYGVLDWQPLDPAQATQRVDAAQGAALVRDLFAAGVTVAYDQAGSIPLDPDAQAVAVIYPGSRPSIRQACEAAGGAGATWLAVSESPTDPDIANAVTTANRAERVVVFTSNAAGDPAQQRLVQALPPDKTVAVALFSPFDWMSFPGVSAYLTTYSPLPEAIPAACAVLFGAAPARGTLPVSLAGVRDFDNGGAQLADGSALSLLPRRAAEQATVSPDQTQVALLFSAPATPTPMPSPLPTETLAPLDSTRRPQATPVPPTAVAAIVQPLPTLALAPEGTDATAASFDWGMLGWVGVLLAGVGLVVIGSRTRRPAAKPSGAARPPVKAKPTPDVPKPNRPPVKAKPAPEAPKPTASPVADSDNGVFLARCVVCNQPSLTRQGKRIQCGACHSLLRQQDGGRWLVRVNPSAPPEVIARLNDKTFSEAELRRIERDHQR